MSTRTVPPLAPDDLLALPDGDRYELVDGIPREKPVGAAADEVGGLLLTQLNLFVRPAALGRAYPETGYRCFPHDPGRVRKPDVSFVSAARLPNGRSPDGYFDVAPDLAVEVVSPNDLYEDVEAKLADYFAAGVPLVWVVSPGSRTVQVRRADGSAAVVRDGGTLSGEGVVPGFACPLADLFT